MPAKALAAALSAVDWNGNAKQFLKDAAAADAVARAQFRVALWAKQFETVDKGNPALCFVREMQVAGHQVAALIALGLYKSAAGGIRTLFETALYYSYFRTHLAELSTLVRNTKFYVSKNELIEYHQTHTDGFNACQAKFDLINRTDAWYSEISAIIHGQIPGAWVEHTSLSEIKYVKATQDLVVESFRKGEELVHILFLCTVGRELWDFFPSAVKKVLISGLPGDTKKTLKLDSA